MNEAEFKKLDVFHGLSNELPFRKTSVKKVVTIHDVIFKRHPELYGFFDRTIYDYKTRKACETSDRIIAISEFTKRDLMQYYQVPENKIQVVYQDCHTQFYEGNSSAVNVKEKYSLPESYLLCVGTIEKRKSQLTLIKAIEGLDENVVLIGKKTNYWKDIEQYLEQKPQLRKRVKVISNADFSDFPKIYQECKLFIYPSVLEGFGIPVIEALNSKAPVITTRGTVMEEACGEAGTLFEPENSEDLKEKIEQLLSDEDLRKKLILKGEQHVLKFRRENVLAEINKIYHEIL